jgi:16S rRNA processing protein RimM
LIVPDDAIVVGRVAGGHGLKGAIRLEPFNDPADSVLRRARRWYLSEGSRPAGAPSVSRPFALPVLIQVLRCRLQGGTLVATIEGVDVREVADALKGCEVAVSRSEFPAPGRDEYYWIDLIGCAVDTPAGQALGRVAAVDDHGAHPLLRLTSADGRERLIPFVPAHVVEVDVGGRRIVADWDPDF